MLQNIGVIATIFASIVSLVVAVFTYLNLKELRNTRFEESRAYITFYIDKIADRVQSILVIKNFGKTAGKLLEISIDPPLKPTITPDVRPLTECKNVYLAPNQSVTSVHNFEKSDIKQFHVTITYETMGKIFKESYEIDMSYRKNVLNFSPVINDEVSALRAIQKNIQVIAEKSL